MKEEPDLIDTLDEVFGSENVFVLETEEDFARLEALIPPEPWLCPICGSRIHITGTTTNNRLIGSCRDAFRLDQFLQETSDLLRERIEAVVEDASGDGDGDQDEWARLSRVAVEIGLPPLVPLEKAVEMFKSSTGVFQLESFEQIKD